MKSRNNKKRQRRQPLWLPFSIGSGRTMFSGEDGSQVELRLSSSGGATPHVVGQVRFAGGAQGPPGHVHGGAVAYILDEAMGAVGWLNRYPVMAAQLSFKYHLMSPLERKLNIDAWVVGRRGRRLLVRAELKDQKGRLLVSGEGRFAILGRLALRPFLSQLSSRDLHWATEPLKFAKDSV